MTIDISIPTHNIVDAVLSSSDFTDAVESIVRDTLSDAVDPIIDDALYEVRSNVEDLESRLYDLESERADVEVDQRITALEQVFAQPTPAEPEPVATHPGQEVRRVVWTSDQGVEYGLSLNIYHASCEMQFDLNRVQEGVRDIGFAANITPGAARLLRDRLDYFLSQVGR